MQVNNQKLKKVDSSEIGLTIKVVEEQYLQDNLDGNLYFGSLDIYIQAERENGDKVIGDANEGQIINKMKAKNIYLQIRGTGNVINVPMNDKKENVTVKLSMQNIENIGICCFTRLSLDDYEIFKVEGDLTFFQLRQSALDELKEFIKDKEKYSGNPCRIILFKPNEFWQALHQNNGLTYGMVEYYDTKDFSEFDRAKNSKIPICFFKPKEYKKQREFRIAKIIDKGIKGENIHLTGMEQSTISVTLDELKNYALVIKGLVNLDE